MTLGQKIQMHRSKHALSQEQLAEKITVSRQAVSKWELDQSTPDVDYIIQLSKIFDVSTDYLLNTDESESHPVSAAVSASATRISRATLGVGLTFFDIVVGALFIVMFACVIVFAAFALCCLFAGVCLIARIPFEPVIPYMPYSGALFLGLSLVALSVTSAIGTWYCWKLSIQTVKTYATWHTGVWNGLKMDLTFLPQLSPKQSLYSKKIALYSGIAFVGLVIIGMIILCILAGYSAPWHHWHWFE